jgi:hypothetical protein
MSEDFQEILRDTAEKIKELVANAATMNVETWYVEMGVDEVPIDDRGKAQFRQNAHPAAMTEVRFDGDSIAILPMRRGEDDRLMVDRQVKELHDHNVKTATDYRAGILNSLVGLLKDVI